MTEGLKSATITPIKVKGGYFMANCFGTSYRRIVEIAERQAKEKELSAQKEAEKSAEVKGSDLEAEMCKF